MAPFWAPINNDKTIDKIRLKYILIEEKGTKNCFLIEFVKWNDWNVLTIC